jgi:hypothetical protein
MPGRVDSLLAEMPAKESGRLPRSTVDRLRQMEPDLPEGEDIRIVAFHAFPFGVAAITSSRLIIVLDEGAPRSLHTQKSAVSPCLKGRRSCSAATARPC